MVSNIVKMLFLGIFCVCLSGLSAEFIVTHSPSHVTFTNSEKTLKIGDIQNVITEVFGLEPEQDFSWTGVQSGNPFKRPKANVLFSVERAPPQSDLKLSHTARYSTDVDVSRVETENVVNAIHGAAVDKPLVVDFSVDSTVFEVKSHQPKLFQNVPATHDKLQKIFSSTQMPFSATEMGLLNTSVTEDLYFLGELLIIKEIIGAVRNYPDKLQQTPVFFHFKIRGLDALSRKHGINSQQLADATRLLENFLDQMTKEVRSLFNDNVLVEVVVVPKQEEKLVRKARDAQVEPKAVDASPTQAPILTNLNLAEPYTDMFPVMFNIILWLMVILTVAIIGISYGIWFMDPGRDSIIYRMTSQRIKKD